MDHDGTAARPPTPRIAARPLLTLPLFAMATLTAAGGLAEAAHGRWWWVVASIAGFVGWVAVALDHARARIDIDRSDPESATIRFRTAASTGSLPLSGVTRVVSAKSSRWSVDVGMGGRRGPVIGVGRALSTAAARRLVEALNVELGFAPAHSVIVATDPATDPDTTTAPDQGLVGVPA